ncbi:auxin-responsive protein IAA29 isoform X2 [Ziziphus jujuba]|uniref:Auxin-responsive protein n=1 Tax=Ziziphus jujuba TaxID=326968 RepID=A0A6P4ACF9_ZIZJJ|nr:auxin-responsive protein IAA29 isoform X2 [Ziziphus jujuba]
MELELGLALPVYNPIKFELLPKKISRRGGGCLESRNSCVKNKRSYEEAFGEIDVAASKTRPLLLWNGQPNEEDDRKGHDKEIDSETIIRKDEEDAVLVGWPPIKSSRKKMLHVHGGGGFVQNKPRAKGNSSDGSNNSMYVKVKMEGVAITRKIDMRLYHSYHTLKNTLISMFSKYQRCNQNGGDYILTYQDKEGDWLLAADVPWKTFIESVQRLEIRRNWEG